MPTRNERLRERLAARHDATRAAVAAIPDTVPVPLGGIVLALENLTPGAVCRLPDGDFTFRLDYLSAGSATVTVVQGARHWRSGERITIGRSTVVEVV
jgi:hypothetical protein